MYIEPISLLDSSTQPNAGRYVVEQVLRPHSLPALEGALLAAAAKVRRGHFTPAQLAELDAATAASAGFPGHPVLAPLAEDPRAALAHDVRRPVPAEVAAVCRRLALATQAGAVADLRQGDPLLAELIRESLFEPNPELPPLRRLPPRSHAVPAFPRRGRRPRTGRRALRDA